MSARGCKAQSSLFVCVCVCSGWYAHGWSPELGFVVSGGLVPSNDRMADLYVLHHTSA